ncbi:MAG TPA: protein phosphatase 2C domain-containing protein, partial [Rhodothermales bacterium]|nr:protein phosphatase 2C domain-containing protein [Rhodothermales bacterium]
MTTTFHTHCLTGYGLTHPGLQHFDNEDAFVIDEERQIYAVIDGVGGASAGEIAASITENVIRDAVFSPGDLELELRRTLVRANNEIIRQAALNPEWKGMGCVVTLCCVHEDQLWVAHVGDTRLYKITQEEITKLTKDHSPVGALEDAGEITEDQALMHPYRNVVHRMLGAKMLNPEDNVWIDVTIF